MIQECLVQVPEPEFCEICGDPVAFARRPGISINAKISDPKLQKAFYFVREEHSECIAELTRLRKERWAKEEAERDEENFRESFSNHLSGWTNKVCPPHDWQSKTFESMAERPGSARAFAMAKAWKTTDPVGLAFMGPSGTGKSHLAWAIVNRGIEDARAARTDNWLQFPFYANVSEFLHSVRKNNFDLPAWVDHAPVFILDDLGVENITDWSREILFRFLERRIAYGGRLIITTNLTLNEMKERLHERITSRILELCVPVKIEGDDVRVDRMKRFAAELTARSSQS